MTTKPEPLTEAEEQECRRLTAEYIGGGYSQSSLVMRLYATLDAARARLTEERLALGRSTQANIELTAQLTAATQRAERTEAAVALACEQRDNAIEAFEEAEVGRRESEAERDAAQRSEARMREALEQIAHLTDQPLMHFALGAAVRIARAALATSSEGGGER